MSQVITPVRVDNSTLETVAGVTRIKDGGVVDIKTGVGVMKYTDSRLKVFKIQRAMNAASGDVAYTGFGGRPQAVIFSSALDFSGALYGTYLGVDDAVQALGNHNLGVLAGAGQSYINPTFSVGLLQSGGNTQTMIVKQLDADGFTGTWTKAGSPAAATADIIGIAIF